MFRTFSSTSPESLEFPQYSSKQASGNDFHVALGVTKITSVSGLWYTTYQVYTVKYHISSIYSIIIYTVYITYHKIISCYTPSSSHPSSNCQETAPPPTPSHQPEMRSKVLHCPMDRCFDQTSREDLFETSSCQIVGSVDQINRNNSRFSLN